MLPYIVYEEHANSTLIYLFDKRHYITISCRAKLEFYCVSSHTQGENWAGKNIDL